MAEITRETEALINSNQIVEELKAILVEGEFNSRWELIQTYHKAGEFILDNFPDNVADAVQGLAPKIGKSERTLWYAVKFKQAFPSLDDLPEGKNISMNKLITKYLTVPKEECEHLEKKQVTIEICIDCGKNLGAIDNPPEN